MDKDKKVVNGSLEKQCNNDLAVKFLIYKFFEMAYKLPLN